MKAVVQRVCQARVMVEEQVIGEIKQGLVVLLGVAQGDQESDAQSLADKIRFLRIFSDDTGKMNQSVHDINGAILVISQFTLLANTDRGRRPSFEQAASPDVAQVLYESFIQTLRSHNLNVETGRFGSSMVLSLDNDGPVTLLLDTNKEGQPKKS